MTIKRILFRAYIRFFERLCLMQSPRNCFRTNLSLQPLSKGNSATDIVTIAFNNDTIIPIHIRYVKKYYLDEYTHIIADNSNNEEISAKIRSYCIENGVPYIRLPKNHLKGSYSHATALNWVYKHIIKKRKPAYFGYIDHDLFPIKPISFRDLLDRQHIYGPQRIRGNFWYLSAILSFFDFRYLEDKKVDFMPVNYDNEHYLDTGGGNWPGIYSSMDEAKIHFCSERLEGFREGEDRYQDKLEFFDEKWLHSINGSNWKQIAIDKESLLPDLIRQYEQ